MLQWLVSRVLGVNLHSALNIVVHIWRSQGVKLAFKYKLSLKLLSTKNYHESIAVK